MVVFLRVAYLWLWLTGITLVCNYFLLGRAGLAKLAAHELGPRAIGLLHEQGPVALYSYSIGASVMRGVPYFLIGAGLGLSCRAIGWWRAYQRRRVSRSVQVRRDRWGGALEMHGAPLEHDSDIGFYKLPKPRTLHASMSPLERDAFALLHSHSDWPADLDNYHGVSLAQHAANAWRTAVERHGVGSLAAMIALCHDLGKIEAYRTTGTGTFVRVSHHASETLAVVRRLPGLLELATPVREAFLRLLSAAVTGAIPVDLKEGERAILRTYQHADFGATGEERGAARDDAPIDAAAVVRLVEADRLVLLRKLNINQRVDASTAAHGWYVPEADRLWLGLAGVHRQLLEILPMEIVQGLPAALRKRTKLEQEALSFLAQIVAQLFDAEEVVDGRRGQHGVFSVRSALASWQAVAIRATAIPTDMKSGWGSWRYEIDIL
jgi:hypothetical protein